MRSLFLIVRRELQERVRSKPFRLFTAGLFVVVLGAVVAIDKAPELFGKSILTLGISSSAPETLKTAIEELSLIEDIEVDLVPYESVEKAEELLQTDELDALLADDRLTYASGANTTLSAVVNRAVFATDLVQRLDDLGLSDQERQEVLTPRPIEVVVLAPGAADEDERQFIGFIAALALFMTITFYGNWILAGTVEEKSSRVVEVLLGLVHPHELLTGKTLGILIVAVAQLAVAIAGAVAGLIVIGTGSLPSVALDVVLVAVPLYMLGLLLFSLCYAAAGAIGSRQADAEAAALPFTIGLLVPFMFANIFVPDNPDGAAATVLSIFPFSAPLVMPMRVAIGSPSAFELVACFALLVPAILLAAVIGGRIYSGVILSGGRQSIRNIISIILRPNSAA